MTFSVPRSTPSVEGVDAAGIEAFLDRIDASPEIELHSLMVVRHGRVIADGWWAPYGPDRPHLLYSLSKSFTSTAAGFAVAEGLLDLDATVLSYFPEFADDVTDDASRRILVRHVLAMASGHRTETIDLVLARDPLQPVRGFLRIPPEAEPGSVFAYNQPCTYSVAAIIQRLTGQTLSDYLRPRLFEPLGIERYGWLQRPPGCDIGFSGFHATTAAIAHLGLLYLQRGRWGDRQLLSQAWVDEATRCQVANPNEPNPDWRQGYGFQFWMARHGYRGDGAYGQFCIVLPEQDLVIATTAETENMQGVLDAVWECVLPAVRPVDVETAATADAALRDRLAAAALPPLAADAEPADPTVWVGRELPVAPDPQTPDTVTAVGLDRDGQGWSLRLRDRGGDVGGRVGHGSWQVEDGDGPPMAISGGWVAPDRFRAEVIFLETPHRLHVECTDGASTARWQTVPLHRLPLAQMRVPTG